MKHALVVIGACSTNTDYGPLGIHRSAMYRWTISMIRSIAISCRCIRKTRCRTNAPRVVVTYTRPFGKRAVADIGFGNFAMRGSWAFGALTNVDFQQSFVFAGARYAESPHASLLVALRRANFTGLPSQPLGPSPAFSGSLLVIEQRYRF